MAEIYAADNVLIQTESQRWHLYHGRDRSTPPVAYATRGGLIYTPEFSVARRLPDVGIISPEQMSMIVLGYAAEDQNWHLGALLTADVADGRGSRWLGLAHWGNADRQDAEDAGQALSDVLGKPFRVVPPSDVNAASSETEYEPSGAPNLALMTPPIRMHEWTFVAGENNYQLARTPEAARGAILRMLIFIALAPLFAILSIGALGSSFAPVSPSWLPIVGLFVSVLMVVLFANNFIAWRREALLLIDGRTQMVRLLARNGGRILMQTPYEGIDYILVSHITNKRQAKPVDESGGDAVYALNAEIWIHAFSRSRGFIQLAHLQDIEGRALSAEYFKARRPLAFGEIDTPAHHIGGIIARELEVPVYVEERQ